MNLASRKNNQSGGTDPPRKFFHKFIKALFLIGGVENWENRRRDLIIISSNFSTEGNKIILPKPKPPKKTKSTHPEEATTNSIIRRLQNHSFKRGSRLLNTTYIMALTRR